MDIKETARFLLFFLGIMLIGLLFMAGTLLLEKYLS